MAVEEDADLRAEMLTVRMRTLRRDGGTENRGGEVNDVGGS